MIQTRTSGDMGTLQNLIVIALSYGIFCLLLFYLQILQHSYISRGFVAFIFCLHVNIFRFSLKLLVHCLFVSCVCLFLVGFRLSMSCMSFPELY